MIITRSMADKLFPGQQAVGKSFYSWGDEPMRVVGVVEHLVRPSDQGGDVGHEYSAILPIRAPYTVGGNYVIRVTDPARRDEVLKAAVEALKRNGPNRIILADNTMTVAGAPREVLPAGSRDGLAAGRRCASRCWS